MTFVAKFMSMPYKQVTALDYLSFSGLFESCERNHAADMLEYADLKLGIAAASNGGEEAFSAVQDKLSLYRFLSGYGEPEEPGDIGDLIKDFGRGI